MYSWILEFNRKQVDGAHWKRHKLHRIIVNCNRIKYNSYIDYYNLLHSIPISIIWLQYYYFIGSLQIENSREEDQGKYECVAENSVGTEHSKATVLFVKVRRVPPTFSRPPPSMNEVMLGSNLNLSCTAVGSPMPSVRWMKGTKWKPILKLPYSWLLDDVYIAHLVIKLLNPNWW